MTGDEVLAEILDKLRDIERVAFPDAIGRWIIADSALHYQRSATVERREYYENGRGPLRVAKVRPQQEFAIELRWHLHEHVEIFDMSVIGIILNKELPRAKLIRPALIASELKQAAHELRWMVEAYEKLHDPGESEPDVVFLGDYLHTTNDETPAQ